MKYFTVIYAFMHLHVYMRVCFVCTSVENVTASFKTMLLFKTSEGV